MEKVISKFGNTYYKKSAEKNNLDVAKHYKINKDKVLKQRILNLRIKRGLPIKANSVKLYNITIDDMIHALKKSSFDIPKQYELLKMYSKLL